MMLERTLDGTLAPLHLQQEELTVSHRFCSEPLSVRLEEVPLLWWAMGWSCFGLIRSPAAQHLGVVTWTMLVLWTSRRRGEWGPQIFCPQKISWWSECDHGDRQCFLQSQWLWSELFGTGNVTLAIPPQHYGVGVTGASVSLWFGYASCFLASQGCNLLLLAAKIFLGWKLSHSHRLPEIIPAWPIFFPSSSLSPLLGFSGNQGPNVFLEHTWGLASVVHDTDHCTWQNACASSCTASFHWTTKMWLNGN